MKVKIENNMGTIEIEGKTMINIAMVLPEICRALVILDANPHYYVEQGKQNESI